MKRAKDGLWVKEEPPEKKPTTCSLIDFRWEPEEILADTCSSLDVSRTVCNLFDQGCSIPFVARYRQNQTNAMEADDLRYFQEKYESLKKVRVKIEKLAEQIQKDDKLTPSLKKSLECISSPEELELISAPFKSSSKQTLAARGRSIAGLEKCAQELIDGSHSWTSIKSLIDPLVKGKESAKEVETSVGNIVADIVVHDPDVMLKISDMIKDTKYIQIQSLRRKTKENSKVRDKYGNYHDFTISYQHIKPHQILALNRGESEKFLSLKIIFPDSFEYLFVKFCVRRFKVYKDNMFRYNLIQSCIEDGFKRLVLPSAQRRIRSQLTQFAMKESINVFAMNLRKLLLTPPLKNKTILGLDPGFQNGCKMAVVGMDGEVLGTEILYLHNKGSHCKLSNLIKEHRVEFIALGNGTACRETETLVTSLIKRDSLNVMYTIVNEQGASIYSCSKLAKKEFPTMEPNLISAVSIASRLRDPLAEYLKIEPKHLGVGMYQHDVSECKLKKTLEEIVSECVSFVGVDLNTAPSYLLEKVSGLNVTNAKDIIEWRKKNKSFKSRYDLMDIKGIGKKKFELAAGFVRIFPDPDKNYNNLSNPLDSTMIHPESYDAAKEIIIQHGFSLRDVGSPKLINHFKSISFSSLPSKLSEKLDQKSYEIIIGGLSSELKSDCRETESKPLFRKDSLSAKDLVVNKSILQGKVVNVTHFGAFIDCGVGIDGLLHTSKMCGQKIELGQRLSVRVISLDISSRRMSLKFEGFE
nr:S1 RNA-binding domain-containing protein 1-like [Lepeophtheirus salmonis]